MRMFTALASETSDPSRTRPDGDIYEVEDEEDLPDAAKSGRTLMLADEEDGAEFPVHVWVVNSDDGRYTGLSDKNELPKGRGMLFDWEEYSIHGLVMRDMNFAVDMAFLDEDGRVQKIVQNAEPGEEASHSAFCRYAIELPAGTAKEQGITEDGAWRVYVDKGEESDGEKVPVDNVHEAPDDVTVHHDEEIGLYYEKSQNDGVSKSGPKIHDLDKSAEYPEAAPDEAPEEVREAVSRFREEVPDGVKVDTPLLYWLLGASTPAYKMGKGDAEYQDEPKDSNYCGNCEYAYYSNETGNLICSQIRGPIDWDGWCKFWDETEPEPTLADVFRDPDGRIENLLKQMDVDVFQINAPEDSDYEESVLAVGVDFPNHDVYVDWNLDAWGDDQLDDAHVSIYGSIEDLEQVADGEIEFLDTVSADKSLDKRRVYIDDPSEAPQDVQVQEGDQGGYYYETGDASGEQTDDDTDDEEEFEAPDLGEPLSFGDLEEDAGVVVEVDGEQEVGNVISVTTAEETIGDPSASISTDTGGYYDFEEVDEVYEKPEDYVSPRWQEVRQSFDSETAPDGFDITQADHMGSLMDYGIIGGADVDNMQIAEMGDEQMFLRQGEDAGQQAEAADLYNELGVATPRVYHDENSETLVTEEVDGVTADEAGEIDSQSFVDAMAASTLLGNFDVGSDNLMVDDGEVILFDFDQVGQPPEEFDTEAIHMWIESVGPDDVGVEDVQGRLEELAQDIDPEALEGEGVGATLGEYAQQVQSGEFSL